MKKFVVCFVLSLPNYVPFVCHSSVYRYRLDERVGQWKRMFESVFAKSAKSALPFSHLTRITQIKLELNQYTYKNLQSALTLLLLLLFSFVDLTTF